VLSISLLAGLGGCLPPPHEHAAHTRCQAGERDDTLATAQRYEFGSVRLAGALCGPDDVDVIRLHGDQLPVGVYSLVVRCLDPLTLEFAGSEDGTEPALQGSFSCDPGQGIDHRDNIIGGAGDIVRLLRFSRPGPGGGPLRYDIEASWLAPAP
jgi:hypothetical protein